MRFDAPWAFLLLLVIPLLLWLRYRHRRGGGIRFSTTGHAAQSGRSLRQRLSAVPLLLRLAALVLFTIALARPQKGRERIQDISKGIAIQMVVDRSGSMSAEMEYQGERLNRLEVVKRVFQQFVLGNGKDLPGRPNDLVGMIAFARYPDTVCPLTLAHGVLEPFLESVRIVTREAEDGTAIGDALALAAARLKKAEDMLTEQTAGDSEQYEIKSKIVILLTDGENNAGRRSPLQAAKLAAKWGIKIYTIGVGGGDSVSSVRTPFGDFKMPMRSRMDEGTLKAIAKQSNGLYRRANSAKALQSVYKEIDRLERSEIESVRFMDYKEMFVPYALLGLALLVMEVLLTCTVFRKMP